jgi:hypothetical protein
MLMLGGEALALKPSLQGKADTAAPGLMLAQVAPSLNPFVQLPVTASTHAAVLLPAVRVHVAVGGVPSPKHDAAQVAPTVLLRQPAIHTALLMGMLLAVGTPGQVTARQGSGHAAAQQCFEVLV